MRDVAELPVLGGDVSRRTFVKVLGSWAAMAGLEGCMEPPAERILPYANQPPEVVPGVPRSYATAHVMDGYATGLLVQTREGRAIKVEGNPDHPASLGAAGVFEQGYLLQLYDPSRGRRVEEAGGGPATWGRVSREVLQSPAGEYGRGLHLLLEPTSSLLRGALLDRIRTRLPEARIHFHTPVGPTPSLEAFRRLTGRPLVPRYRFEEAEVVVSFDADFVSGMPFHLRYARHFARRRALDDPEGSMNRLYLAEPNPSAVAPVADHALPVRGGDVPFLLAELVRALGDEPEGLPPPPERLRHERPRAWIRAAARDLQGRRGAGLVLAGESQPPAAHALAHRANELLGNLGTTVVLQESVLRDAGELGGGLERLTEAMRAGDVETLLVLEGNPAYTAPADLEFASLLEETPRSLYLGPYRTETAERTGWYVPAHHPLEAWGDARAFDGTLTPIQPLIRPLYDSRSVDDVLLSLLGRPDTRVRRALRDAWRGAGLGPAGDDGFEAFWEDALSRGLVEGTAVPAVTAETGALGDLLSELDPAAEGFELGLRPDPGVHDGRFANNAWLQELPDPTTKLTWGNAALLSPRTAERLGVEQGDFLVLSREGRELWAPALPTPGHVDDAVTLSLGYGREGAEQVARGLGVDAYRLRTTGMPRHGPVEVAPDPGRGRVELAISQPEWHLHDRPAVLRHTLEEYRADPDFTAPHRGEVESWYTPPEVGTSEQQWGMTIDLSICTGCSACVVACQAENNIPVVGPEDVRKGRIMHWIRIDRYIAGPEESPTEQLRQPMLCQHCEKAPCEYVCPVNATVHSEDGLNEMVYNRCVGTRFCSNNCPYKVRRFNWFDYNERRAPEEALVLNPDVTVRERGVMEKCTYCVQRIRRAQRRADAEDRDLGPGEVTTACQQACPTRAITFGDLTEAAGPLARTRENDRINQVLHHLGTKPRTQYLAKITNPNPELEERAVAERPGGEARIRALGSSRGLEGRRPDDVRGGEGEPT